MPPSQPSQPSQPHDDLATRLAALSALPSAPRTHPHPHPHPHPPRNSSSRSPLHLRPLNDPPPPPTREDVLADRLRQLRQRDDAVRDKSAHQDDRVHDAVVSEEEKRGDEAGDEYEDEDGDEDEDGSPGWEKIGPWKDIDGDRSVDDSTLEDLLVELAGSDTPIWITPDDRIQPDTATATTTNHNDGDAPQDTDKKDDDLKDLSRQLNALLVSPLQFPPDENPRPILPSAPSSIPTTLPSVPRVRPSKLLPTSRAGFTDADASTWCIVCLDDATLRCVDCDAGADVYCARCWRGMHRGPMAGVEDWGHRAVEFMGGEKKSRRVLLGA